MFASSEDPILNRLLFDMCTQVCVQMKIRRQTTKEKQQNKIVVLIYLLQILSVCLIYNIFYKQINNAENE